MAARLERLEARRRREELVLARHRRRARVATRNLELRLGAMLELADGGPLDAGRVATWLERAATHWRDADPDDLHRLGDARLLALAADRGTEPVPADDSGGTRMRERRIAWGGQVAAAGLGELSPVTLLGLLLATTPEIGQGRSRGRPDPIERGALDDRSTGPKERG